MLKNFGHVSGRWGGLTSKKLAASATEGGACRKCHAANWPEGGRIEFFENLTKKPTPSRIK